MTAHRINLYEEIGGWGIEATDFAQAMSGAGDSDIELHIQSPGGSISDGFAIANMLKAHRAKGRKVVAVVDGFCASAATFPAMVADELHMHEQSVLMIHSGSILALGGADDMDAAAQLLRQLDGLAAKLYAGKSGATTEQVAEWMGKDTYFTPQQALDAKLIDKIIAAPASAKASARAAQFLAKHHAPDQLRAYLSAPAPVAAAPTRPGVKMKSTPITRRLTMAAALMMSAAADALASTDPDEKLLGEQAAATLPELQAQLADVKDAPDFKEVLRVHDAVAKMAGTKEGLVGYVEGLQTAASAKGQGVEAERMVQVDALLRDAVNPPKGQPRKLTPQQSAAKRAQMAADPRRTIADLKMYLRESPTLPSLNTTEDQGAKTATGSADGDAGDEDAAFDAEFQKHAMGGKVVPQ